MKVPANLFVVGAAKSATSTLHAHLARHPDVWMSDPKEPHYFSHRWREDPEAYAALFTGGLDRRYRGESSTGYSVSVDAPARVAKDSEDARILLILRNPIDRAWSHYWWLRLQGQEDRPFAEAFDASLDRPTAPADRIAGTGNFANYHDAGRYGSIVARWLACFPADHLWIATFEDLVADPDAVLAECYRFLGLEAPRSPADPLHANPTAAVRHPRLARVVRTLGSGPRLRAIGRRLPVLRRAKAALLDALRRPGPPADYPDPPAATRARLAAIYAPEVALLRDRWPAACAWWTDDFPGAP